MSNLEQTKGTFKLIGKVVNIDRENAMTERTMDKGKNKGREYRNLRFGIQTAPDNMVQIGMFSFEPIEVYVWETENRKGGKMPYDKWKKNRKVLEKQKKIPLETAVGLERDEEGKTKTQHLPSWDAIAYIHDNLFNGDSVLVEGDISYNTYTNKAGQEVTSTNYNLKRLFALKQPVDFQDKDFEETSVFTQEFVFEGVELDEKEKKAVVFGKSIGYAREDQIPPMTDVSFEILFDEERDEDGLMEKMAKTYAKKVPYGSLVTVHGNILNKAISQVVESDEDVDDDVMAMLGGERNRMETTITYKRAMEIRGTDSLEREKYTEEDLSQDDSLIDNDDSDDDLGDLVGAKKSKSKIEENDFLDDDDNFDFDDMDDSDLPF